MIVPRCFIVSFLKEGFITFIHKLHGLVYRRPSRHKQINAFNAHSSS